MGLLLTKALGVLLMPPGLLLLGGIGALILGRYAPARGRVVAVGVLILGYLLSIRPGAEALLEPLEAWHPPLTRIPPEAEAIVVLSGGRIPGSPEYSGAALGDSSLQRVRYAARLARGGDLPLYATGGSPLGEGLPAGRLMARALAEGFGLAPERIRAEVESRNTAEHVSRLYPLLKGRTPVVLVTTAWHMPRAAATFRTGGLPPIPAPTDFHEDRGRAYTFLDFLPTASALEMSRNAFHEYLGLGWYWLRGSISLPSL